MMEVDRMSIERCARLARQLVNGRITWDEYAFNATIAIIGGPPDEMAECVGTIPAGFSGPYAEYLKAFLLPVDFMPCPRPFVVDANLEDIFEKTKQRLRGKYIRLLELAVGEGPEADGAVSDGSRSV